MPALSRHSLDHKYSMVDLRQYAGYLQPQGNIGCCTASATLKAAEIICNIEGRSDHFSRLFVYYMTRKLSGRLNQVGAELKDTLAAVKDYGVCVERSWPFSHQRLNIEPSQQVQSEAMYNRISSYDNVISHDFNALLENRIPIIIGLRTGRLFWKLKGELADQAYKSINTSDNRISHGHAVVIVGYNNSLLGGSWIIANSLGPAWGHRGYGALPYECRGDIGEAYVIREFSGVLVGKKSFEN